MKRRNFIKTTTISGLACTIPPFVPLSPFHIEEDYTTDELMGKAKIELYGKDINLPFWR